MADKQELDTTMIETERILRTIKPREATIDISRVMFAAGRASCDRARSASWMWPLATALSLTCAVGFAFVAWQQPRERVVYVERESDVEEDAAVPSVEANEPPTLQVAADEPVELNDVEVHRFLRQRDVAVTHGIDAVWPDVHADESTTVVSVNGIPKQSRQWLENEFELRSLVRPATGGNWNFLSFGGEL